MPRCTRIVTIGLLLLAAVAPACGEEEGAGPEPVDTELGASFAEGRRPGGSHPKTCGQIDEFAITPSPQGPIGPMEIVTDPDGMFWFTTGLGSLGLTSPDGGTTTLVPIPSVGNNKLIIGPDGNVWVSAFQAPASVAGVSRRTHAAREILLPELTFVADIAAGPDHAVWALGFEYLARITLDGRKTLFPIPTDTGAGSGDRIVTGPDGNLWFTRGPQYALGFYRVTPTGAITRFPVTTPAGALEIAVGPDHTIWYTHGGLGPGENGIGRITMDGVTSNVVQLPDSTGGPTDLPIALTQGPDGKMYFTTYLVEPKNYIGQVTPRGALRKFEVPTPFAASFGITTGSDGNIWFTENFNDLLGRLNLCEQQRPGHEHRR